MQVVVAARFGKPTGRPAHGTRWSQFVRGRQGWGGTCVTNQPAAVCDQSHPQRGLSTPTCLKLMGLSRASSTSTPLAATSSEVLKYWVSSLQILRQGRPARRHLGSRSVSNPAAPQV